MSTAKHDFENVLEWAEVEKLFRCGKQGIVGVLKTRTSPSSRFVFKISQYIDYLIEHEHKIMSRLSVLQPYCPHFCINPDLVFCLSEAKPKKYKNPFDIVSAKPLYKPVLIEEYIKGPKLGSSIDSEMSLSIIMSAIKQVLVAIVFSHDLNFTHYDLHTDNVILNKCNDDKVFLYILDKETAYVVPSNGHCARIIDYGFSYIDSCPGSSLTTSFLHTDIGYTNDRFDWLSDAKLFLVSISYQLNSIYPRSPMVHKFTNCVQNMFNGLSLDWECGWDSQDDDESISNKLIEYIDLECRIESFLFKKHPIDSMSILQGIIQLPLQSYDYSDLVSAYTMFLREFTKIEQKIETTVHLFYILKTIVDSARHLYDLYIDETTRKEAVSQFKNDVFEGISVVAKFCTIPSIHFERMLCGLYSFSECANGYYYKEMQKRYAIKKSEYDSIPVKTITDILNVIYYNTKDEYKYSRKTIVTVCDKETRNMTDIELTIDQIEQLNNAEHFMKATMLHEIYKSQCELECDSDIDDQSVYELSDSDLIG